MDALERIQPGLFSLLRRRFLVDEFYEATVIRWHQGGARLSDLLDRLLWGGIVKTVSLVFIGLSWASRLFDESVINLGFDQGCERVRQSGSRLSRLQDGQVQHYLRVIGLALTGLVLLLTWGCRGS